MTNKDGLYANPMQKVTDFVFDERVARVFPDMISRSVPGYATIISLTGMLAAEHATPGSNLYDLGSSLGASSAAMQMHLQDVDCQIIAVDNASAMLQQAADQLRNQAGPSIDFVCSDIRHIAIQQASVVVLNFTLQFLPIEDRLPLLSSIQQGMLPDGVLILSEKIAGATPAENDLLIHLHQGFKRANGYTELEISQKRSALDQVLLAETIATHKQRLQQAGFSKVDLWFQCFNFVSFVARP